MSDTDEETALLTSKPSFRSYQSPTDVQTFTVEDDAGSTREFPNHIEFAPQQLVDGDQEHALSAKHKKNRSIWNRVDPNAFQFALRMAILLAFSSLFVLVRTDDWHYPDAMWVHVSVLFVCWFPSLDAASVIEKIIQRLIGTFVGAFLGLSCGFYSLTYATYAQQAIFLFVCMFVFNFLIIFLAGQCKVGPLKVIRRFAYATILCTLTFAICMIPFAADTDPKWETGVWRIINVVVGCILGALGSIVVCPKSTTDVLLNKTAKQVQLAGEACEALLHTAADFFAGRVQVNRLADELLTAPLETTLRWKLTRSTSTLSADSDGLAKADVALKKYEDAIGDWRVTKMLFPLTHYDPFSLPITEKTGKAKQAQTEIARTLARALRIQTTIVVLDGMVRSDAEYIFTKKQIGLFHDTGTLIKEMLTIAQGDKQCLHATIATTDEAARNLFGMLEQTRKEIVAVSSTISTTEGGEGASGIEDFKRDLLGKIGRTGDEEEDDMGRGIPKNATTSQDNSLFFLQLVEHLILRSLRLYQAWKHVEIDQLQERELKEAAYM